MKIFLILFTLFFLFNYTKNDKKIFLNKSEEEYYDSLFNSIESDFFSVHVLIVTIKIDNSFIIFL